MSTKSTDVIATVESWFKQAPALPENAREVLVKISPILALIFGILGIITGLGAFGLLTAVLPLAVLGGGVGIGGGYIAAIFLIASGVLMLLAYPGLQKRSMQGWTWLFWGEVLNVVYNVVSFNILGAIIGALIGFYILFQIKSYYK